MKIMTLITTLLLSTTAFANATVEIAVTNTKNGESTLDEVNYRVLFATSVGKMGVPAMPANEDVVATLQTLQTDGIYECTGKRFKGTIFSLSSCIKIKDIE